VRSRWLRLALIFEVYLKLIVFDFYLARGDFGVIYRRVRTYPTGSRPAISGAVDVVCAAVDVACIWYWKEVLCLQRAATIACLLKARGEPAQLVIGVQQIPFRAHAWVEVDGCVVNDKAYTPEIYKVLERC
jgi:hypothetical protein